MTHSDDRLSNTPSINVQCARIWSEGQNNSDYGCADDKKAGTQQESDDRFPLDGYFQFPQKRKRNHQNGGIGDDVQNNGDKEVLHLECTFESWIGDYLPVFLSGVASERDCEEDSDIRDSACQSKPFDVAVLP